MKTIVVIGGRKYKHLDKFEKAVEVIHHYGKVKQKNAKRIFERLVRCADCIILYPDACSHQNMYDVKDLSKKYDKKIIYPKGTGVSNALQIALEYVSDVSVA